MNDWNYEQYEKLQKLIDNEFPNANFTISIGYDKLDDLLSYERTIYILDSRKCYCYKNNSYNTKIYKITSDKLITYRLALNELIKQGLTLDCNHCYFEGFHKLKENSNTFEIMTGS